MQEIYMSSRRLILIGALLLCCAAPAAAQSVKLAFHDGRVDITAQDAPLRTILAEWSRVGGTTIVNADRVGGLPVTLELTNVPERSALDVLLRSVSGYMAGPRAQTAANLSSFDSILIVPTSTPAPPAPMPVRQTVAGPPPVTIPQIDADDPEENPATDVAPGTPRQVNGPRPRVFRPPVAVTGPGVVGGVVGPDGRPIQQQPEPDDDQPPPEDRPEQTPSNPFGVAPGSGSATPGVISPVPQQPQQRPPQPDDDPEP
jgi:hypothetical protein